MWRRHRAAQQRVSRIAEIAREQDAALLPGFLQFEKDAGGTQDMAGVEERSAQAWRKRDRLSVGRGPAEIIEAVQRVRRRIKWFDIRVAAPCRLPRAGAGVLFLQVRGVEHDETRKFARGRGGDDFAAKAALRQK